MTGCETGCFGSTKNVESNDGCAGNLRGREMDGRVRRVMFAGKNFKGVGGGGGEQKENKRIKCLS